MGRFIFLLTVLSMGLAPGGFATAANKWNIKHEQIATFEATVVDVLCELSNDCPADCGAGKRQLGLLRDDGTLLLVAKGNTLFAGAVEDLQPHCGATIEVDGLLIDDPQMRLFFLQRLRSGSDQDWRPANQFGDNWKTKYPQLKQPWWNNDPLVIEIIQQDGVLGIPGLEP